MSSRSPAAELSRAQYQEIAERVIRESLGGEGMGLITTADETGVPHATWMATLAISDSHQLVTLTSPDSRKVKNIKVNPNVEWLITGRNFEHLVYLSGTAEIVSEIGEIKEVWKLIDNKDRAFFLDHAASGIGFAVIRTGIQSARLVIPKLKENHKIEFKNSWAAQREVVRG
ncbi:MAG: pyridoxamine 5'-phosphate oxidase family protein [Verrucomicrobiales bacterium]|nr:pyridoxamine 5'-phosphate oxidase family protein [Verrucomicrobiales bacterium]